MKLSVKQGNIFMLVLSTCAFIYSIADIINQIKSDFPLNPTSLLVFFYSLIIIIFVIKDWNKYD